jgi:membrane-bound lytic murein transglycosylase D
MADLRRLLFLGAALALLAAPTQAQNASENDHLEKMESARAQPVQRIPLRALRGYNPYADANLGVASDSLTETQILRRLSRLYSYQADILVAQADGDIEHAQGLLELAMADLAVLAEQPNIRERPRYREVYRSLVTEYERLYGTNHADMAMAYDEIFQFRADMFAELAEVEEPLEEEVSIPELPPMETTIPMTMNRLVESSISFLLRNPDKHVNNWMRRADTYFPMIEKIMAEEGVPDEMKYLAMIESALIPTNKSWAKAVGMWQFIQQTGGAYGLRVTSYEDDRMDPEKATRAAARHLRDLYEQYDQNWHIAIAGYNCSPRCIKRAIRRSGKSNPTFWDIYPYLPTETRNYVPMFIATALVASNPSAFGLMPEKGEPYTYDVVSVHGMLALEDAARLAGTDLETIKSLNPALRRSTLPPADNAYDLRIPEGTADRFIAELQNNPPKTRKPAGTYTVRRGDSLGKIGNRYGVSVTALKNANGLRRNTIHPGQRLTIPGLESTQSGDSTVRLASAQARTVAFGERIVYPIKPLGSPALASASTSTGITTASTTTPIVKASTSSASSQPEAAASSGNTRVRYKVRRGDTLNKIAAKYGVSVRDIQGWNNLRGTRIRSGQQLTLYSDGTTSSQPERVVYKVRRGDNLTEIARKHGVSVSSLKSWNNLRSSTIRVGQRLTIHPGQSAPNYTVYKVRRGDSLGKIAQRNGTTVSKLKSWNNLRRNTIVPGQRIKIYK